MTISDKVSFRIADIESELKKYADDSDIKTFLNYFREELGISPEEDSDEIDYYKMKLSGYLIRYSNFIPLYLHLDFLYKCYTSYIVCFGGENKKEKEYLQKIADKIKQKLNLEENESTKLTDVTRAKILNMIIENYKENRFYYYFHDNSLNKVVIKKKKTNKGIKFYNDIFEYIIQDEDKSTFLIDTETNIKYSLKKHLIRDFWYNEQELLNGNDNTFMYIINDMTNCISYTEVQYFHNKIVDILKDKKDITCKCCNPNFSKPSLTGLCDHCKNLFDELQLINEEVIKWYENDDTFSFKNFNFKKFLYDDVPAAISTNCTQLRQKRKNKLISKLNELEKEINKECDAYHKKRYDKITEYIKTVKENLIPQSFDN